ncbi:MAG: V0D/AC39 family V-type ATPase subunit [Lachnospiraceae bacterium]
MSGIFTYSGITTKVRAMKSKLIKPEEYQHLAATGSVSEALSYLNHFESYADIFSEDSIHQLHRREIESNLIYSLYHDFSKLYHFANLNQRKFLDLYFMHYEIALLKVCLQSAYSDTVVSLNFKLFQNFLNQHSDLDLNELSTCKNMDDFIHCMRNSRYYPTLHAVHESSQATLFDYETSLDLHYFNYLWKEKDKILKGKERELITEAFGSQIDLLNLQWIFRAKKFYRMNAVEIYSLIVPINYRIKKDLLAKMVESETLDELIQLFEQTPYVKHYNPTGGMLSIEKLYTQLVGAIFQSTSRHNPYSIASINHYLYQKEQEINQVIRIIESIRYGITPDLSSLPS